MIEVKPYTDDDLFEAGIEPTEDEWNERVHELSHADSVKRWSMTTVWFAVPMMTGDDGGDKVDISDVDVMVRGYMYFGSTTLSFVGKSAGTYFVQISSAGALSATLTADPLKATLGTAVWGGTAFGAVTVTATVGVVQSGVGDMIGPGASVAHHLTAFSDTGGKQTEDSGVATADVASAVSLKHAELHGQEDHTPLAEDAANHDGLNYAYREGMIRADNSVVDVPAGSVTLTDDILNYIEVSNAGTVSANTGGFTSGQAALATALTASGVIVTVVDKRAMVVIATDPGAAGDVISDISTSVIDHIVVFATADGKHIKSGVIAKAAISGAITHAALVTGNPHGTDAADVGAEEAGAVATHEAAYDHTDIGTIDGVATDATGVATGNAMVFDGAGFVPVAVAESTHTHAQLHDRSHAITGTSDHTATAWRVFYSDGSGNVIELALGADGTYMKSNGASAAPTFATPAGGTDKLASVSADDTTPGYLDGKLVAGDGIDFSVGSPAGDETLTIKCEDASTTNAGIVTLATTAEIDSYSDLVVAMIPSLFAASKFAKRAGEALILPETTALTTGDGKYQFRVLPTWNGYDLSFVEVAVLVAGVTNPTTFDLYNVTKGHSVLTTNISIASGATSATGTIDTSYDDLTTGDMLRLDCDAISTTAPMGLIFIVEAKPHL